MIPTIRGGMREVTIAAEGFHVGGSVFGSGETVVVLGHGAGGSRQTPLLRSVAVALADSGRRALLYDFRYVEMGRRAPDPPRILEATTAAADRFAREELGAPAVVHGGKSMGGRIASQVVAKGLAAEGLVFLGYPLHPPGRTERLRDGHLAAVSCPLLFLQGTRDALARWDLIEGVTRRLGPTTTLKRLEGADHSYRVLKRSGRTAAEVESEVIQTILAWLDLQDL